MLFHTSPRVHLVLTVKLMTCGDNDVEKHDRFILISEIVLE